jgi:uncharacterized membrane protein
MPTVESDITVDAPIERVYQAWTNYESFPTFMENVKEVRRTGPDMTRWVVEAAGQKVEWDAKTTEEDRRRVAWRAHGETGQSGEVRFERVGDNKTKLNVKIDYSLASGTKEAVAKLFQIDDHVLKEDLKNFKEIIEKRTGTTTY